MAESKALVFNCPVEAALEAMGGKWKPVILWHLSQSAHRFGALKRAIPRVSEKVLIEQLRQLEKSGVVSRHVQQTVPPSVTYSLTEHGQSLKHAIEALSAWGLGHAPRIGARILIIDGPRTESGGDHEAA